MNTVYYPRLIKRIRAVMFDSVLVPLAAIATLLIGVSLGVESLPAKIALFIGPILLLEPGLVAWTGGTVGHHVNRIKIIRKEGAGHIGFLAATLRFVVKVLLGWFSLIFILTTRKHQAVHDIAAGSVVVHKDISGLPEHEVLTERKPEESGYRLPSIPRRLGVIFLYLVFSTFTLSFLVGLLIPNVCLYGHRCTLINQIVVLSLELFWLASVGASIVLGWRGRLYGCRRQRAKE